MILGTDKAQVPNYLAVGQPVIVSVTSGDFTDTGHTMVLAAMQDENVIDFTSKRYAGKKLFDNVLFIEEIAAQSLHFWTFTEDKSTNL